MASVHQKYKPVPPKMVKDRHKKYRFHIRSIEQFGSLNCKEKWEFPATDSQTHATPTTGHCEATPF